MPLEVVSLLIWGLTVEKHTPGPWFPIKNHHYWEIRTGGEQYVGQQIGDACSSQFLDGGDNGKANATLMAAAPDLLAACQGAMRIVSLWNGREVPEDHEHAEEMKALSMMQEAFIEAIAKAEGKECFKTFDCNAGDHSDCCPATGNSIG